MQFRNTSLGVSGCDWPLQMQTLQLPGEAIAIEITEGLLLEVDQDVGPKLNALREAGLSISLDDFGTGYSSLTYLQRYPIDLIKDAWEELKELEPRPGRRFVSAPAGNVIPDLSILPDGDGRYIVQLEDEYTPRLNISRRHIQMLSDPDTDPKTREWIKRKIESAKWLIESIEQRHNTLKRVAQAIVDRQTAFLDKGPEFIVPLKMQQIADVVGVHVTTVSRAVDDKWIQTPRGLFPLKRFFGGGTKTDDGDDDVAWSVIRIKLQEVIDKEDKSDPLSDDSLVEEMKQLGYVLARRTVTKYRKKLNIPSSRQRKQY